MNERKVIMALSGGMDSSTMLAHLLDLGYEIETLNFTYGSKHNEFEIKSAELISNYYNVPYKLIDLTIPFSIFKSNLLKSGGEIPEGHYNDESMTKTVVPGRNSIFACILMGYAQSVEAGKIALGVHKGDHFIYPDCREEYIKALDTMIYLASDKTVEVIAPFININKIDICKRGLELKVPYELTRTCYKEQEFSCGKCGSCRERLEAFELNQVKDPIIYDKQEFQTLEGISVGIEIIKNKINKTSNALELLNLTSELSSLLKRKEEINYKYEEKNEDINKKDLEDEIHDIEEQIKNCKKEKNKILLNERLYKLKKKLNEVDNVYY